MARKKNVKRERCAVVKKTGKNEKTIESCKTETIKEKPITEKEKKKESKQLKLIIGIMVLSVILFISIFLIFESMKKFEYGGLEFEKIMYDQLPLYYSGIPITNENGETVNYYNMYLRNDPRKLRNITIEGEIRLMRVVTISVDSSIEGCEGNGIAGFSLGTFLNAAGMKTHTGTTNLTLSEEKNITYATCELANNMSVVIVRQTGENKIVQESQNCYSINFANCEINQAVERFMVATVAHSKDIKI